MAEGDGIDGDGADGTDDQPGTRARTRIGVLARLAVALVAVALGFVWIVRLAFVGSTLRGGLLFELLAPLVLLYFGIDYLRTQRSAPDRDSSTDG